MDVANSPTASSVSSQEGSGHLQFVSGDVRANASYATQRNATPVPRQLGLIIKQLNECGRARS
eukprot:12287302-Heterocapsa_arctica.AAC.1